MITGIKQGGWGHRLAGLALSQCNTVLPMMTPTKAAAGIGRRRRCRRSSGPDGYTKAKRKRATSTVPTATTAVTTKSSITYGSSVTVAATTAAADAMQKSVRRDATIGPERVALWFRCSQLSAIKRLAVSVGLFARRQPVRSGQRAVHCTAACSFYEIRGTAAMMAWLLTNCDGPLGDEMKLPEQRQTNRSTNEQRHR